VNVDEIIDNAEENRELDFKDERAEIADLVFELVAFANSGGGDVIYGVNESGSTIEEVQNISNPSKIEEGVHQVIREKVSPKFTVLVESKEYTGEMEAFHGNQVLMLSPETDLQIHSFRESGSSIFYPYRLGSTTDHLTGDQIYRFYEDRIRPGRLDDVDPQNETGESNTDRMAEIIEALGAGLSEAVAENHGGSESTDTTNDSEQDSSEAINLSPSENPYDFTPAGGLETITFRQLPHYLDPKGIEGDNWTIPISELPQVFAALYEYLDADLEGGHFTISQRNAAWFGQGAADFIEALDYEERYSSTPDSFEVDKHHSEGTIFVTRCNLGIVILRARRGINGGNEYIDEFSINFCTDGVPVDTRSLNSFLDALDYGTRHAQKFEMESQRGRYGHQDIEVEPVKLIQSEHHDDFVGWAICENPFYENPDCWLDEIESEYSDYESLTKYEKIPCRIKDHHPVDEPKRYSLIEAEVTAMTSVQGAVPHENAMIWINW